MLQPLIPISWPKSIFISLFHSCLRLISSTCLSPTMGLASSLSLTSMTLRQLVVFFGTLITMSLFFAAWPTSHWWIGSAPSLNAFSLFLITVYASHTISPTLHQQISKADFSD